MREPGSSSAVGGGLDTSGEVREGYPPFAPWRWPDLSPFEQGYVGALFASANGDDGLLAFSDLAPSTLEAIRKDCAAFYANLPNGAGANEGAAFCRSRQDGSWYNFPPLTFALGDDGKLRLSAKPPPHLRDEDSQEGV